MISRTYSAEDAEANDRREGKIWRQIRTGGKNDYNAIRRDSRGYPIFVKGSHSSREDNSLLEAQSINDEPSSAPNVAATLEIQSPAPAPADEDRGRSIATFYSQLPREESKVVTNLQPGVEPKLMSIPPTHTTKAQYQSRKRSDWFIKRAAAQLEQPGRATIEKVMRQSLPIVNNCCAICSSQISPTISPESWEAHRSSIAHQLAADGSMINSQSSTPSAGYKGKGSNKDDTSESAGRIMLKPSNVGYTALERMGWRKGLGLGREEWEYAKKKAEKSRWTSMDDAIAISDSEEEDDDAGMELGSEQWLAKIGQAQSRLKPSQKDEDAGKSVTESVRLGTAPSLDHVEEMIRVRPLLEPLSVQIRPDRRGIGRSISSASKARQEGRKQRDEKSKLMSQERLTKRQRLDQHQQKKEEWKHLRNSLN